MKKTATLLAALLVAAVPTVSLFASCTKDEEKKNNEVEQGGEQQQKAIDRGGNGQRDQPLQSFTQQGKAHDNDKLGKIFHSVSSFLWVYAFPRGGGGRAQARSDEGWRAVPGLE